MAKGTRQRGALENARRDFADDRRCRSSLPVSHVVLKTASSRCARRLKPMYVVVTHGKVDAREDPDVLYAGDTSRLGRSTSRARLLAHSTEGE